jgi:hypothetical protein
MENTGKALLYFYKITNNDLKEKEFMVSKIDYAGNILNTSKLFSFPANTKDYFGPGVIASNPSKTKFLLCTRSEYYYGNTTPMVATKMLLAVCDADGKKVWSYSMTPKSESSAGIFVFDDVITDNGDVYVAYKKYTNSKGNETVKDDATKKKGAGYTFHIAKFQTNGNSPVKTINLEKDVYIYSAKLMFDSANNQLRCLALFGNENKEDVEGIINAVVDKDGNVASSKKSPLPPGEDIKCYNREAYKMYISDAHFTSDGGMYVVCENSFAVNATTKEYPPKYVWVNSMSGGNVTFYGSYGITVFLFDKTGSVAHSKTIPRNFVNINSDYYCGIFSSVINDKLYLFYNAFQDDKRNNTRSVMGANLVDYGCIAQMIDKDFNVSRKVLYPYAGMNAMLVPSLSNDLAGNKVLLFNGILKKYGKSNFDLPQTYKYAKVGFE